MPLILVGWRLSFDLLGGRTVAARLVMFEARARLLFAVRYVTFSSLSSRHPIPAQLGAGFPLFTRRGDRLSRAIRSQPSAPLPTAQNCAARTRCPESPSTPLQRPP